MFLLYESEPDLFIYPVAEIINFIVNSATERIISTLLIALWTEFHVVPFGHFCDVIQSRSAVLTQPKGYEAGETNA